MSIWDAAKRGNLDGVKASVQEGADIEEYGLMGTVLCYVCYAGYVEIVKYLLDKQANVDAYRLITFERPLHLAAQKAHLEIVKLLLQHNADVNSKDRLGDTPLHVASKNGQTSIADYLIQHGAEVNSRGVEGFLPIHYACENGHLEMVKLLIKKGSYSTLTTKHRIRIFGKEIKKRPTYEKLTKDEPDESPLQLARRKGHTSVAHYLIQHGAQVNSGEQNQEEKVENLQHVMQAAVSETLSQGKKKNNRISVLFIGQDRVGKTSLKKSLLGKESKKKELSTIGIDFDVIEVHENDKSKPWKRSKDDQFMASKSYTDSVIGKEVARTMAEGKNELGEGEGEHTTQDGGAGHEGKSEDRGGTKDEGGDGARKEFGRGDEDGDKDGLGRRHKDGAIAEAGDGDDNCSDQDGYRKEAEGKSNMKKNMEDQLHHISGDLKRKIEEEMKNVENYRDDTMDIIRFMLGDVAGQSVFYDVHSIMLRLRTIFVLVIDLSKSLTDEAHPKFVGFEKGTKKTSVQGNPQHETNFDYVIRWMAALRNLSPCNRVMGKNPVPSLPKTILVFTKPDKLRNKKKVEQKVKEFTEALEQSFERIGCDSLIVAKYVIKNTSPRNTYEADQLKGLRETIFETAQDILKAQEKTPISWLLLERAFGTLRRSDVLQDRPYITRDEAQELGEQCQVNDSFNEAMKFFHEENIVVHFDDNPTMSDVVVLDAAWLVKLFTQVLTVAPKDSWGTTNSRAWRKLTTKGVLDFDNLPNSLDKQSQAEALKDIMVRVGLICRWRNNVYLVPSMVTRRWKESEICRVLAICLQPSLYLDFKDDTIPLGLYTRFQVELLKWARGDDAYMPEFHSNCCRIFKYENGVHYSVILVRHVSRIQVAISVDDNTIYRNDIARSVLSALDAAMMKVQSCPSYKGIRYDLGLKCDLCREDRTPCLRHQKKACKDDDCVCILTLESMKNKSAFCPRNRCGKNSSELNKTFWVNVTERGTPKESSPEGGEPSTSGSLVQGREEKDQTRPPDHLKQEEIVTIAQRIPKTWRKLAFLTKQFEPHEIDDLVVSRCNEDESEKALTMLTRYIERQGTRQMVAHALDKLKMFSLAQDVLSGSFIQD